MKGAADGAITGQQVKANLDRCEAIEFVMTGAGDVPGRADVPGSLGFLSSSWMPKGQGYQAVLITAGRPWAVDLRPWVAWCVPPRCDHCHIARGDS